MKWRFSEIWVDAWRYSYYALSAAAAMVVAFITPRWDEPDLLSGDADTVSFGRGAYADVAPGTGGAGSEAGSVGGGGTGSCGGTGGGCGSTSGSTSGGTSGGSD